MTITRKLFWLSIVVLIISCSNNEQDFVDDQLQNSDVLQSSVVEKSGGATEIDLLWDIGLNKRSIIRHSSPDDNYYSIPSDLSEADNVGNPRPPEKQGKVYITEIGPYHSPDSTAASVTFATYQHDEADYGQFPGFDLWFTGGWGQPANYKFKNNTRLMSTVKLREVGLVTTHWPEMRKIPLWSFRDEFRLNQFNKIEAKFTTDLEIYREQYVRSLSYLTCDFRISYRKENYKNVRVDVIGVVFCNLSTANNPEEDIVYKNFPYGDNPVEPIVGSDEEIENYHKNVILLDAEEIPELDYLIKSEPNNGIITAAERTLIYDFKPLIENYLPAPPIGMGYEDAIIVGLDIYSAARGCDITFNVNNVRLIGTN
ncbi:MAG: hypothetical protein AAFX55_11310 [Bacteroidota bacterium]